MVEAERLPHPHTIQVELHEHGYPIYIGHALSTRGELLERHLPGGQVLIVTNETVGPLHLKRLTDALGNRDLETLELPDGERYKTLDTVSRIYDVLIDRRFDRSCTLIALGGGVVGDITGFAAATYQRGVAFIQVPTTLLALVDSSVGGKTGVNHPRGKNMIGAFHQPRCVVADIDLLDTLPDREIRAGIAEVVKYGLIRDHGFFQWLEGHMQALLKRDPEALAYAVEESCRNKAAVVAADEREAGQRALLNLGHTFGHAIETWTGYSQWLHGEAVAAGMCMAARMSMEQGSLSRPAFERIERLIRAAGLPTEPPPIPAPRFLDLMAVDKKARGGRLRLVLLQGVGDAVITRDFDDAALERTLAHYGPGG